MKKLIALALIIFNVCYGQTLAPNAIGKVVSYNIRDFQTSSLNLGQNDALIRNMATKLPLPNGTLGDFILNETLISEKKIQNIQTFDGVSTDGTIKIKVTVLADKIEALMHTPDGYFIIEPFDLKQNLYLVYGMNEIPADRMKFGTNEQINNIVNKNGRLQSISPFPVGSQLRTYRMAIAATGELVTFYGGQANALARIVSIMNAANLIYEIEAAIHFQLITATTNYSLLFTNPETDPFVPDPNFSSADQSQTGFNTMNTNGTLPYANYDVGHTFNIFTSTDISSRARGGLGACDNSSKARAWTEWSSGTDLSVSTHIGMVVRTYVAAVGFQFSASHTNNAIGGSLGSPTFCTDFWSSTSAIEPGGGSTFMGNGNNCAYPTNQSLTGNNRLQYFHTKSLETIYNYLISTANCFTSSSTGNTPPVSNAGLDIMIPKGTPFKLTGSASDANSDAMSYTWEQYDVATENDKGALGSSIVGFGGYTAVNSTTAPLFRSEMTTTTTERTFPKLAYVLNNANNPDDNEGEDLPQVARTMKFRFTVRDNRANGGGVDSDETLVTVVNSGPFLLTSQNEPSTLWFYNGTNTAAITWSVNGTNTAPLNVANVKITFSTDGGNTFPIVLAASTPNDGSETITIPNNQTTQGRIKIEPVGSFAFFDINNVNITITTCNPGVSTITPANAITASVGNSALNLGLSSYGSAVVAFGGVITNTDNSGSLIGNNSGSCINYGGNLTKYDIIPFRVITSGSYTFTISGHPFYTVVNLYNGSINPSSLCTNWIASTYDVFNNTLGNTITMALTPGVYYLMVSSFSATLPTLPANYIITPSGGTIYNFDGPSYAYTYPVVNSANTIVAFSDNSDLTNTTVYPVDVYTVYGLSYYGGANLNSYVGTNFSAFQTLLNNSTVCGKLSTNSKSVTVIQQPCPTLLTLVSTADNYSSGSITKQAAASNGKIEATNLISGSANVTYEAKSIELKPGFKAENGTVFKAKVGGCGGQ